MSKFYDLDPNAKVAATLAALTEEVRGHDTKVLAKILAINTGYLIEIWKELEEINKQLKYPRVKVDT